MSDFEIMKARAEGYRQAREDIAAALESGGPVFLTEGADLRGADKITLIDGQRNEHTYEKIQPPEGEWITVKFAREDLNDPQKSKLDFVKCPFCETIHQGRHHFCSYCGARMKE